MFARSPALFSTPTSSCATISAVPVQLDRGI